MSSIHGDRRRLRSPRPAQVVDFERDPKRTRKPGATDLFLPLPLGFVMSARALRDFEKSDFGWDLVRAARVMGERSSWASS